ncbi:MAG: HAEPLYID family protein [Bernardetiaceae bacterium]
MVFSHFFRLAFILTFLSFFAQLVIAQDNLTGAEKDSLYILEVEDKANPDKVLHAEPLYIDLIRDLGARKGEKEWNVGLGVTSDLKFDSYEALVEYEFAPIDRLGLEIEVPFLLYAPQPGVLSDSVPANRMESLKLAAQWSFFVNEKIATSMAIGYLNEFEFSDFSSFGRPLIKGNLYNPFFVIAKRWGSNYHTLIYTGPRIEHDFRKKTVRWQYDINTSFHYMIPGTRNFIGLEVNKTIRDNDLDLTLRPQMRLGLADNLLVGIVAAIPLLAETERLGAFVRLIWEPGHKH